MKVHRGGTPGVPGHHPTPAISPVVDPFPPAAREGALEPPAPKSDSDPHYVKSDSDPNFAAYWAMGFTVGYRIPSCSR